MITALWIAGAYFAFVDIRSHRIPNKSLLLFSMVLLIIAMLDDRAVHFTSALIALVLGTVLSIFAGLGFGDVKLITILALFVIAPTRMDLAQFLFGFAIAATLLLIFTVIRRGKFYDSIPMAPSIFAGAILCASLT